MLSERSHRKTDLYYLAGKVYGEAKEQIDNFKRLLFNTVLLKGSITDKDLISSKLIANHLLANH
jgi:hypothetical protein